MRHWIACLKLLFNQQELVRHRFWYFLHVNKIYGYIFSDSFSNPWNACSFLMYKLDVIFWCVQALTSWRLEPRFSWAVRFHKINRYLSSVFWLFREHASFRFHPSCSRIDIYHPTTLSGMGYRADLCSLFTVVWYYVQVP